MIRKSVKKEFEPGHGYTKQDWDAVESPPLTKEQMAKARPFAEAFPHLAETMKKNAGGRPPLEKPKLAVSIRLDQDVVAKFRATGPGWQSRVNDILKLAKV